MSKALLVINDLPNDINIEDVGITYLIQRWNGELVKSQVESVPLKPLPKKQVEQRYDIASEYDQYYIDEYATGWNDCIDEILGEEE